MLKKSETSRTKKLEQLIKEDVLSEINKFLINIIFKLLFIYIQYSYVNKGMKCKPNQSHWTNQEQMPKKSGTSRIKKLKYLTNEDILIGLVK